MKSSKVKKSGRRAPYKAYWSRDGPDHIPRTTLITRRDSEKSRPSFLESSDTDSLRVPVSSVVVDNKQHKAGSSTEPQMFVRRLEASTPEPSAEMCHHEGTSASMVWNSSPQRNDSPPPSLLGPDSPPLSLLGPDSPEQNCFNDDSFNDEHCHNFYLEEDNDGYISEEELHRQLLDADPMDPPPDTAATMGNNTTSETQPLTCEPPTAAVSVHDSDSEEELAAAPQLHLSKQDKVKLMLLLATKKKLKLSYAAAEAIVEFSNILHADDDEDSFQPSKYLMKRAIDLYSFALTEHHICPGKCGTYIGIVNEESFTCPKCHSTVNTSLNRKDGNFFLYLSLEEQLRVLFEKCLNEQEIIDPKNRQKINQYNYEDLFDGSFFKKCVDRGVLTINTFIDGLQIATTSKSSAWPVLGNVNEMPLHLRRKYMMMGSVWLSKKKPKMNEYLKPFVDECKKLYHTGIRFKRDGQFLTQKFQIAVCVSDSIARPLLRNTTQFNGEYGCGLCYHPGISVPFGKGHVRSYSTAARSYPLRTHTETMTYASQAEALQTRIKGVRGRSILADIPKFDIITQLDPDSFHCLVNVAKRFVWLWFDEKFAKEPFSIRKHIDKVDQRLLSITPTDNVSRFPRSLHETSDYRGHEWYHWIMNYSVPCLKNILPAKFLNHWAQLPSGLALIMQNSVAKTDVCYAGRHLDKFVSEIDLLYGAAHVTFSNHLLTHLCKSVELFGQMACHSGFIYEAENAEIKDLVKSGNGAIFQISKGVQLKVALKNMESELKEDMTSAEREYFKKMTTSSVNLKVTYSMSDVDFLGPPSVLELQGKSLLAFRRAGISVDSSVPHTAYLRCIFNNEVYHGLQYTKAPKQNNTVALLEDNSIFMIDSFVVLSNSDVPYALGYFIMESKRRIVDPTPPHLKVLKSEHEGTMRCIPVSSILSKLLSFSLDISKGESCRYAYVNILSMEMLS